MQESGITEITPWMCTSALWGQYPVLTPRASSALRQGAAVLHWLLDGRASPPSWVSLGSQRLPLKGYGH